MSDFSIDNLVSSLSEFWPLASEVSRNIYKISSDQIDPIIKQYELDEDGLFLEHFVTNNNIYIEKCITNKKNDIYGLLYLWKYTPKNNYTITHVSKNLIFKINCVSKHNLQLFADGKETERNNVFCQIRQRQPDSFYYRMMKLHKHNNT